jgi:hypothetical protein
MGVLVVFFMLVLILLVNLDAASLRTKREKLRRLQRDLKKAQRNRKGEDVVSELLREIEELENEIQGGKDPPLPPKPKPELEAEPAVVTKGDNSPIKDEEVDLRESDGSPNPRRAPASQVSGGNAPIRVYIETKMSAFRRDAKAREEALATRVREWLIGADTQTKTRHKNALNSLVVEISQLEGELASLWEASSSQVVETSSVDIKRIRERRLERAEREEQIIGNIASKRRAVENVLSVAVSG